MSSLSATEDDSGSSFDESEKLSAIGDELVQKSLEEVTNGLNCLSSREGSSKRVTFAENPDLFSKATIDEENDLSYN